MTIDERIKKMEGQLIRMTWLNRGLIVFIVLSLAIGLTFLLKSSGVKEIRANKFIVEDDNGKPRVILGLGMFMDMTELVFRDENDTRRVGLSVNKEGSGLTLYDKNGETRASLSLNKDGPTMLLLDQNGKIRTWLDVSKDVHNISLRDENGELRVCLSVHKKGQGLSLYDENGKVIWMAP